MGGVLYSLAILGILGLAGGLLLAGTLNTLVHSRKDCPICWQSIPANAEVCPQCKAKL